MSSEYSEQEKKLIEHYEYSDLVNYVQPISMYRLMADKAFIINEQNKYSESLRRCMIAFNSIEGLYRMTPEWDAMIVVD